jgi:membrane-associated phospholipid phosphatase
MTHVTDPSVATAASDAGRRDVGRSDVDAPAERGTTQRPILAAVLVVVGGYVAMAAVLTGIGELVVNAGWLGGVRRWDDSVGTWLVDHRNDVLNDVTAVLSQIADTLGVVGLAVLIEVVLAICRRWRAMLLVPLALALEFGTFLTVNTFVGRDRPDVARLGSEPSTSSFPSGHTAATLVVWGAMVLLFVPASRRVWRGTGWVLIVVLALAVGTARVYRGMHHPSDVIAGALMGAAALTLAALAMGIVASRGEARHSKVVETDDAPLRPGVLREVS